MNGKVNSFYKIILLSLPLIAALEITYAKAAVDTTALPAPNTVPSSTTSSASIVQKLNGSSTGTLGNTLVSISPMANKVHLVNELHIVTATAGITPSSYQPYVYCANGGLYVNGSLTAMGNNTLIYFCALPVYPAYYSATNPAYYDAPNNTITYSQLLTALVPWSNPTLASNNPLGASEQITTNPIYGNGLVLTTFQAAGCGYKHAYNLTGTPIMEEPITGGAGLKMVTGVIFPSVSVTTTTPNTTYSPVVNTPITAPASLSWPSNSPFCTSPVATAAVPSFVGQVVYFTIFFGGTPLGLVNTPLQTNYSWTTLSDYPSSTTAYSCSGSYVIKQGDLGNTIDVRCDNSLLTSVPSQTYCNGVFNCVFFGTGGIVGMGGTTLQN
jgi:hypothetical protein